ncbi:uncharacterized protein [Apostichopus japonicus]|uniref:uncharacterized protein isoform X3 n=1 Tax=Stichopus japonicus TaxID=307972 RepID=UPI003AB5F497
MSLVRYLFMYGNENKKIEREGSNTKEQLEVKASEVFQLKEKFKLQCWDRSFEEWRDLEPQEAFPTNTKFLIILLSASQCTSSSNRCPLASDVSPSLLTDPPPNLPTSSASTIFSTRTDSNWDLHFQLPEFSSAIVDKLQTGSPPLKEAERSAMLEAIYNAVKVYTYYPKTMQYERIIQKLFKVYPKLANQPNMSTGDVQSIWKIRLQYKFSNARKREDSSLPVVQSRKRVRPSLHLSQVPAARKTPPQWGMINYLPQRQESEDDKSIESHIQWLRRENTKKKPHYSRVTEAMSATFSDRRQLIVKEGVSVKQVQELYPWLFDEDEIILEFQRIGSSSITDLIHDGFTKYADAIVTTVKNKKSRPNLVDKAIGDILKYKDESTRHEATKYAAVIAVPTLVNEKLENMLSVVDETHEVKLPVIMEMFEGEEEVSSYTVKVDGFKVTESSNFMSAFAVYLATFYIFNLVYPTALKKTLNFYQRMILNIQDGLPVDKTVMRVVEKINMNM